MLKTDFCVLGLARKGVLQDWVTCKYVFDIKCDNFCMKKVEVEEAKILDKNSGKREREKKTNDSILRHRTQW